MINNRIYSSNNPEELRKVVRISPDVIVRLNGENTLPGCGGCPRRIDFQRFITSVSFGAGITPDSGNASFEMTIPYNFGNAWVDSTSPIIRKGMEVHIYSKGYFAAESAPELEGTPDIPVHPYYQVFHGVVTGLSKSYSGGFYTVSFECSTMLHFWQFMRLISNPSYLGNRPENTRVSSNLRGNLFNGMSPYAIIYELYRRDVGDPAGIAYALNQVDNFVAETENPDATVNTFYESLQAYWDQRFKQKPYNLRMYGVSGRMFNTLQQAFLGLDNSSVQAITTRLTRRANQAFNPESQDVMQRKLASLALLRKDSNGNNIGDLDVYLDNLAVTATQDGESRSFEFNIAQIDAFVQDFGSQGTVAMFSTEDLSKLEIASTVKDATGFEFYQDVDGDLVYKPPFYNLDTSSSRIYRIEPLDIIQIGFTESEPEATYCIAQVSYFQNLAGTVLEGEWGGRAIYIDWRLVAQYGWRSADLQTSFYNRPHLLYYMAAQHIDITNAQTMYTAQVTIPHRPEMRPGYPVYISHIDTFYYITGLEHSVGYGADATTTLTLCARRKPFYAPGRDGDGISSIDLKNTSLPPKPLAVLKPDGTIKTTGFPNVVMSLDPEQINPRYFVAGADLSSIDLNDPESLPTLIRLAIAYNLISIAPGGSITEGPYQVTSPQGPVVLGDLTEIQTTIDDGLIEVSNGQLTAMPGAGQSVEILVSLLSQVQIQFQNSSVRDVQTEDGILRLLSDRKASFSPNVPGRYRYYSASHPDPDMQGMKRVDVLSRERYRVGSLFLIQEGFSTPRQFVEFPSNVPDQADPSHFAQFRDRTPTAGLNILKFSGNTPTVTPTHEILSLAFAKQDVTFDAVDAVQSPLQFAFNRNNSVLSRNIRQYLSQLVSVDDPSLTVSEILQPAFDYIGPLQITGSEVVALTIGTETSPIAMRVLQEYADGIGISVQSALTSILENQSSLLANQINSLYDEQFAPFNEGSGDPEEFRALVLQYQQDTSLVGATPIGSIPSFTNYFTPKRNRVSYTVPVFPISDAGGYEVVGSFPYGRGLKIEPGASFGRFFEEDPLRFADAQAVQDYVQSIVQSEDGNPSSAAESALFSSLSDNDPGVQTLLSYVPRSSESTDRTELLRIGLSNFQASNRDTFGKLTVSNTAVSLGNILPQDEMTRPCACTTTDTDTYLESYLNNPDLFETITNPQKRASEWMRQKVNSVLDPQLIRQNQLRSGTVDPSSDLPNYNPIPNNANVVDTALESLQSFQQAAANLRSRLASERDNE